MFCKTCKTKSTCKAICKKVNDYLLSKGIYSADYIRPRMPRENRQNGVYREIPLSTFKGKELEKLK